MADRTEKPFRVLTIDGGGMRGLYSATLLKALAERFDSRFKNEDPDIGSSFDLICGTSTGAILAIGLAAGVPLASIRRLYIEHGNSIFLNPTPDDFETCLFGVKKIWPWAVQHACKPAANAEKLKEVLSEVFGQMTIKELYEKRGIAVCIPSVNALNHQAWVFKTPHNPGKTRDDNYRLSFVCLASSAAPILFPLAHTKNPDDSEHFQYFVDGGLWANNPILVGLIEALGLVSGKHRPVEVISVGTCDQPSGDPNLVKDKNWGLLKWRVGINIVEMSLSAQSYGLTHMTKFLSRSLVELGCDVKVLRLEETNKSPEQFSAIGIDKADRVAIDTLVELARSDADAIHSKASAKDPGELIVLKNIFENLNTLKTESTERRNNG